MATTKQQLELMRLAAIEAPTVTPAAADLLFIYDADGNLVGTLTGAALLSLLIATDGNNRVLTSDGDGTLTAEPNLTFDGTTLSGTRALLTRPASTGLNSTQMQLNCGQTAQGILQTFNVGTEILNYFTTNFYFNGSTNLRFNTGQPGWAQTLDNRAAVDAFYCLHATAAGTLTHPFAVLGDGRSLVSNESFNTTNFYGQLTVISKDASTVGFVVKMQSGQTADAIQVRNSSNSVIWSVSPGGVAMAGAAFPGTVLAVSSVLPYTESLTLGAGVTTFDADSATTQSVTGDAAGNTISTIAGDMAFEGNEITILGNDELVTYASSRSAATNTLWLDCDYGSTENGTLRLGHNGTHWYEIARTPRVRKHRATTTANIQTYHNEFLGNTDAGSWTATLPAGTDGEKKRIVNSGSSGNTLTVAPNGSEHLLGVNSNFALADGEALTLVFDATDGWY